MELVVAEFRGRYPPSADLTDGRSRTALDLIANELVRLGAAQRLPEYSQRPRGLASSRYLGAGTPRGSSRPAVASLASARAARTMGADARE